MNIVHGHSSHQLRNGRTPEYASWSAMKARCLRHDGQHPDYETVTICERWVGSFEAFLSDMGPKPSPEHTLDRRDGALGYSPENCRWATKAEQARNRKSSVVLGTTVAEMCAQAGISRNTFDARRRRGLPLDACLSPQKWRGKKYLPSEGATK